MAEEKKKRKGKQERNQENIKQGEREEGGEREREERGKILRGIIWCFVLILIFCNKLMCQLWSGWQKTHVFCHLRIEVIPIGLLKVSLKDKNAHILLSIVRTIYE
jgi:hypothetical protein